MGTPRLSILCLLLLTFPALPARAAADKPATQPFELKDGDRVVFVGGTFMERESQLGYIETMLTSRFPDRNVTFRNLGYAGDTVACEARRINRGWVDFGGPDEGFNRLKGLITEIKPTVVIAAYGMGESFGGEAKLAEFVQKYERLLDMLTTAGGLPKEQVRVVLLSPTYRERLRPPFPDPAAHNADIQRYCHAIRQIASSRGYRYVDLFTQLSTPDRTTNGIHLTDYGYWEAAATVARSLGHEWKFPTIELDAAKAMHHPTAGATMKIEKASPTGVAFSISEKSLPPPPAPAGARPELKVPGLSEGQYLLRANGAAIASEPAHRWSSGGSIPSAPSFQQAEQLRKVIVSKNADYFHYWRPQNDTYILGYRKKEQGRNAVEMPQFLPLVEAKEKEIARLRVPQPVTYTLEKK